MTTRVASRKPREAMERLDAFDRLLNLFPIDESSGGPTAASPGSPEKMRILHARALAGVPLFDPRDKLSENCGPTFGLPGLFYERRAKCE